MEIQPALPQNFPAPWDRQPPARRCPSRQATRGYPITVQETVTGGRTFSSDPAFAVFVFRTFIMPRPLESGYWEVLQTLRMETRQKNNGRFFAWL